MVGGEVSAPPDRMLADECAWWQRRAEGVARERGAPGRMLELAVTAIHFAAEGMTRDEALDLATALILRR